ncbi:MAG: peptidylprolyl isomerase [Desulfurococcales archaeon]|nr:peptidylprolyl isomerase [Desulfurococcales archaeon]
MPLNEGDFVLVHYTIKVLDAGREVVHDTTREEVARKAGIFDPSRRYGETLIVLGKTKLLEAVDEALRTMDVGEKRVIEAPPSKAYGERSEGLVIRVPIKQLRRHNIPPRIGQEVEIGGRVGRITRLTERFAFIDFNHPLAGKTLKIELEVVAKLESLNDKVSYLASKWLGLSREEIRARRQDGGIRIELPQAVLGINDLESRLQLLSRDIYDLFKPKTLTLSIKIEYPEEEKEAGKKEEAGSEKQE